VPRWRCGQGGRRAPEAAYRVELLSPVEILAKQQVHQRLVWVQCVCTLQALKGGSQMPLCGCLTALASTMLSTLEHVQVEHGKRDQRWGVVWLLACIHRCTLAPAQPNCLMVVG
jgi:hypothetical protein